MPLPKPSEVKLSPERDPSLRLGDVDDIVREHPAFSTPAVRALIHRAEHNGLSKHIYRIGRRVLIDLNGFERWVRSKQGGAAA